ncbi:hypothetical protein [Streptomyces sp. NRRL F-5126]|uniref:hypothetical protein n=1 Tax=Streptomyces sp. NRRL F-5126 TaxID=1463857 RepID=UPI0004C5578E|nr:hypothetical protein [Streptomyces sp. NRRL F-5126]
MTYAPWTFLTDADPGPSCWSDHYAPARELTAGSEPPPPRAWFTAANRLAFGLVASGSPDRAAELMELAIRLANRLAARHPDNVEYGLESGVNRIELLRRQDADEADSAYRACYDLVLGRPVRTRHLFGLDVRPLDRARNEVAQRALGVLRYRSQAGLLGLRVDATGPVGALAFAREVVADFPRSVAAGMLHAAEILAAVDPRNAYLQRFDLADPRSEGDLVVLLRIEAARTRGAGSMARPWSVRRFAAAVSALRERTLLRNPRTPLLWALFLTLAGDCEEEELAVMARELVDECSRSGDQRMYRAVIAVVADRVTVPPMVRPPGSGHMGGVPDLEQLLAGFSALGEAVAERKIGRRQRERT